MDYLPRPGTVEFLILCAGLYLVAVNALTLMLCRLDRRWRDEGKPGIEGLTLVVLALMGGWPALGYALWFRETAPVARCILAVTFVATAQIAGAGAVVLPGRIPDMTAGEMLAYLVQGGPQAEEKSLPRRFGPGSE
ncbi:MAG: hypothetical protein M9957_09755 [Rhodobacteraceae bacterium]|nr:hypothetical protein [Paracoccaceae bacterium]